ncbi:hypothetical protein AB0454_41465 [Streptomyces sp. NPDC093509]|uniref:hypothetical protein n=1 Tax=Streptomyces sp. NPDC093509 TaxID=3154982 RepID=UPI00344CAA05
MALSSFARDLALCLAVHRDICPAIVWPEGSDVVVDAIRKARRQSLGTQDLENTAEKYLTMSLAELLSCHVEGSRGSIPADFNGICIAPVDLVLVPIVGNCFIRIERQQSSTHNSTLERPIELRLRVGEALYVPYGALFSADEGQASCELLMLSMGPTAYRSIPRQ